MIKNVYTVYTLITNSIQLPFIEISYSIINRILHAIAVLVIVSSSFRKKRDVVPVKNYGPLAKHPLDLTTIPSY